MKNLKTQKLLALISAWWMLSILALALLSPDGIVAASAVTGDAASGKALFQKRCAGCHSLDKNKEGPRLRGVYLRHAGSVPDFTYSDELKAANITWDDTSLDRWLTNPDVVVPDNDMAFHVSNPQERADIIQFLRLSSGK